MTTIAIIGGTGLTNLETLDILRKEVLHTPFGEASGPVTHGRLAGKDVAFIARHGYGHTIPPHKVNYRANLWALKSVGATKVLAVAAVGAINRELTPGSLALPDQIIDYTYGRKQTYFEEDLDHVTHIDFTYPYSLDLRTTLVQAAKNSQISFYDGGTYGATQGPRLETAAEIQRMKKDGCDMVGMTGMPEAVLARELGLSYAAITVMANWAAGIEAGEITMEDIQANLSAGMGDVKKVIQQLMLLI
ncbi:MAG: S-methyl-5'-thioinosine phosphorylase [Gammaproteobacteria bacterium]|nr:MAG: S-methyl-5'-thioinosine phosphorylase [Gammaproteobacteria bacterium]